MSIKNVELFDAVLRERIGWALILMLFYPFAAAASLEQTFDVLQVGTTTYRNVTVTTKSKNYIFIIHSKGMTNIKVADLPSDLQTSLGYVDPAAAQVKTNATAAWAKQTLAKMETPQVTRVRDQMTGFWKSSALAERLNATKLDRSSLLIFAGALLGFYLLHSYCCLLICRKSGYEPGVLVWMPLLQLIPLLKAATMSPWWIFGFLVPGLNLIAQILWCVKITQARGKTLLVALLLMFPLSSPLAALYLAFSEGRSSSRESRRVEIMTLEAA